LTESRPSLQFTRLSQVDPMEIVELMSNPLVRRHMPLLDRFGLAECHRFVAAKERMWAEHGHGPWAFIVDGHFAGWGGLQPEGGDADLALVLSPRYWGLGGMLCQEILRRAFEEMNLPSVTVLLPPGRTRTRALQRLGFSKDGEVTLHGHPFIRFRRHAPRALVAEPGPESAVSGHHPAV
jgi:[ribosomal protein S5]-alanine N-acetyltransferase